MGFWRTLWYGPEAEPEHERAGELTLAGVLREDYPNTPAGVTVTGETALKLSATWACVRLIADTISTLPVDVYRAGSREPLDKPPILLRPAAGMDFGEWVWCLLFEALTSPAAWCLVTNRTGPGLRPSQLEPLGRGRVTVTNEADRDGRVRTVHRLDGRETDPDNLWRFRLYPMAGTPAGLDPIGYAAETIGQALAAQRYGAQFFGDSAIPSMALVTEQSLSREQALEAKAMWEAAHKGRRGTAVLGNGLTPKPLSVPPEAAQFLETQRFGLQSVCRYFGCPPEMVGSDSGNPKTYASLEKRNQDFLTFGIGPKIARLETALNGLLPARQFTKFNAAALLRTDLMSRYQSYAIGLDKGFLTLDEVRALEDREPLDRPVTTSRPAFEVVAS
jgi:HK97 family phage portal protein